MTKAQEHAFICELRLTGNIPFACNAAQATLSEVKEQRDSSPAFEQRYREAQATAAALFKNRMTERVLR